MGGMIQISHSLAGLGRSNRAPEHFHTNPSRSSPHIPEPGQKSPRSPPDSKMGESLVRSPMVGSKNGFPSTANGLCPQTVWPLKIKLVAVVKRFSVNHCGPRAYWGSPALPADRLTGRPQGPCTRICLALACPSAPGQASMAPLLSGPDPSAANPLGQLTFGESLRWHALGPLCPRQERFFWSPLQRSANGENLWA